MDLTNDYTSLTIELKPDYEGEVTATLISSNENTGGRKSVLYIHGYVDYFFHPHLGEHFNANGYDFYAIDLRKYGRSLMEHQHPNYCRDLKEYFEELTIAIDKIKSNSTSVFLLGHSTGGLLASIYMNEGEKRNHIDGLILNSPFLDFNMSKIEKTVSVSVSHLISKVSDYMKVEGALSPIYPKSIHKDYYGEWDFNLAWKPIKGFPTYLKWSAAIDDAQKSLLNSNIEIPILVMFSSGSMKLKKYSAEAMTHDIVLDVEDIKRVGKGLGKKVTLLEIKDAQHDIFLSPKKVREGAFDQMFKWLAATTVLS